MKLFEIYTRLIQEMLLSEEYHATNLVNIVNILETNKINLSSNLGTSSDAMGGKFFFLSLSRTGSPKLAYDKVKELINKSGYDSYDSTHRFKLEKK